MTGDVICNDSSARRLRAASDTVTRGASLVVVGVVEDAGGTRRAGDGYRVFPPSDTTQLATGIPARRAAAIDPAVTLRWR